jgi:hypothetical protein
VGEHGKRCRGGGSGRCGAGDERLLGGLEGAERLLLDRQVPDERVAQVVFRGGAGLNRLVGPQPVELRARHDQLSDERGEGRIVGVRAGDQAQVADHGPRLARPVGVQVAGVRVEEDDLGHVRASAGHARGGAVEVAGEQGVAHRVPREDVAAPAQDDRRHGRHGV